MNHLKRQYFIFLLFYCVLLQANAQSLNNSNLNLWYKFPANSWTDALPIGNGFIGAMIYGGTDTEHIQFNEATLWTDGPRSYAHPNAYKYLDTIRQLLFQGKQKQAEEIATIHFMGLKNHDPIDYENKRKLWLDNVRRDVSFAQPNYNDSDWEKMAIPLTNGWESSGLQGLDGAVWFRVTFEMPKGWEDENLYLDLGKIRDEDYTYINGKLLDSAQGISTKRHYLIPANFLKKGKNIIAIQVINYFDKGGFTGVKNNNKILVVYPENKNANEGISLGNVWKYKIQNDAPPPYPQFEASYQPFGDVYILTNHADNISDYKRNLDLNNAVAGVSYKYNGIFFKRTYWASAKDKFVAVHFTASKNGAVSFSAFFKIVHQFSEIKRIDDKTISLKVQVKNGALYGISFLYAKVDGNKAAIKTDRGRLIITNADSATLYLTAATNFVSYNDVSGNAQARCTDQLKMAKQKTYDALLKAHIKKYKSYFETFSIDFGKSQNENLPTDERILNYNPGIDASLIALYVQYARYLLISSSPANAPLPANLQGIWNDQLTPSWGSKFTTNINLEMNYWPSEELNLSPCGKPLFNFIKDISQTGEFTAKEHYNAPGWVEHHNTDIWGATAPIDASDHGVWITGSAWLCHNLWEHYLFTGDAVFLKTIAYPIMKSAARFYIHFLIKDPQTGFLISAPSNSPEHGGMVAGPAMDHQVIRDLFKNCVTAAHLLQADESFSDTLKNMYAHIAPNKIGHFGQLQEWMQDIDDTSDTHRHVSHLWGVYPGTDIAWDKDSVMMRAALQSLLYRGDGGTGWSLAWKTNLWARFKAGNHAMKLLNELLSSAEHNTGSEKGGIYRNMFDAHPPFQIDGNFGGAAAIAEMLVQSQNGYIELLPALPSALPNGNVKGICARGGFVLDMNWRYGKLNSLKVHSTIGGKCIIKYNSTTISIPTQKNHDYIFNSQLKIL
ncbi:MAG: glycoside hydrolase N-terminal domain-containing protein [Arachidicoccus sp.]|nr:glycoside hydrolase N-terminal domain-containing protein [Arachidicoccus sp.]